MRQRPRHSESGSVIFFILLAIALIALVTAAIRAGSDSGGDIDRESMLVNVTTVRQQAAEIERAVTMVINNGASETEVRFADVNAPSDYGDISTTPQFQVFSTQGGGADYPTRPSGISVTGHDADPWEFYGTSSPPQVGTGKGDLLAVLPNVSADFCAAVNNVDGYGATQPTDSNACVNAGQAARFGGGTLYDDVTTNTMDDATFAVKPAMEACVKCLADGSYNFYHVLHTR